MDGYTLSISRCSGGDGVEESFKAKIKRREAALDAFAVAEAYCKFGGKVGIGAEEYLSRINIKVYEGDENENLVFEGGAAECLAWADGYCGHCEIE